MKRAISVMLCVAAGLFAVSPAFAHFILVAPDSWIVENKLGDPQKLGPCGGTTPDPGTPTGKVTEMHGGDLVHIKIQETVYHPGHYRVALAVLDRKELPADPEATTRDAPRGPISVSGKIDPAPSAPVLADGLFVHTSRPEAGTFWETDIKLPNINCDKCTLQVVQFMEEHPYNPDGGYTYHHCADFKITADRKMPIDKTWPGQKKK